ncbi:hypothetical protein T484DRAFT_3585939 [Baffinella frigidus]|nr:hypothetical protein T484DRAFT_3585939 [Cryptophyta sp. CCMP2293]
MEVAYCTKAGFTSKKSPLARLHLLPSAAFGKGGSRASRGAAGAVVLARAAAKAKKGQSRVDPCGGEPAGCNPCQERAPFPGQLGPCRNDVRCFTPAKPGNKGGKAGLAALAAAAWRAAEGVVAKATGGGRQGGGGGECRPALCAAGDAACYATALAEPKAGGYPAVDSPEFSCALYDDALFRPAEGVALRRKCKGDARCKHEACGCIELGDRCVHGAEAPGRARASLPSEDTEPDTPVRSTADRGGLGEGRGGAGGVVDAHASPEAYVA